MPKPIAFSPSEAFVDYEPGQFLRVGKKTYLLESVDPWNAYCVRFYWFDKLGIRVKEFIGGLFNHVSS